VVVSLMNIATPIGAFAAGFIAPPVLAAFGWRGAFLIGGAAPMLAAALIALLAPESLKFLIGRRPSDPRIASILKRIAPDVDPASVRLTQSGPVTKVSPFELLNRTFRARTLLLWALLFLNLFDLYVLVSWLPTLLQRSGWSLEASLQGGVMIQAGGVVGGLVMSRFMDRGATRAILVGGFALSAACLGLFMIIPGGPVWVALLLLLGAGVSGSQLCLNALSVAYYPPAIKATGVGWALVVGGMGSILAPLAGAWMIAHQLSTVSILGLLAIPSLLCVLGIALMRKEWQAH
jgi:AAHS family 4-hydroxybenzoate transporter-like MFS transporter